MLMHYELNQNTICMQVYSSRSPCQYKEETYLSATLHVGDAVATNVTDTNCTDMTCSIQFLEVPEHSAETDDIHVSLVVGNRFGESAPVNFDTALCKCCMYEYRLAEGCICVCRGCL